MFDVKSLMNMYKFETNLLSSGELIEFRPITTGAMKSLLLVDGVESGELVEAAFDDLINKCVITEGFNADNLSLQDRFHLLIEIRKKSKGSTFSFQYKCPKCNNIVLTSMDLNALKCKPRPDVSNKIKVNDDIELTVQYQKRGELKKVFSMFDNEIDIYIGSYAAAIESISISGVVTNVLTLEEKIDIINNLDISVYEKIKEWIDTNEYGVEFKYSNTCYHCKHVIESEIQLASFFVF